MRAPVLAETPLERVFKTSQLEAFYIELTAIHLCFQFSFFFSVTYRALANGVLINVKCGLLIY